MIKTAIRWGYMLYFVLIASAVFLVPSPVFATSQPQQCLTTQDCTVGEFLYDDEYQPIGVGATCTLTSRYPNGNLFLNAVSMTASSDGWYSYDVGTSGLATGLYRGQMCCTVGEDYMCLDKTFEVASGLNSSIVADIWSYPSRTLSTFGDLIANLWSSSDRSLTTANLGNGTSLASTQDVASVGSSLSTQIDQVQTTVDTIDTKVTSLQTQVGTILTNTDNILLKWGTYSVGDIINYLDTLDTQLGNNTQTCSDDSVFGNIQCLSDKWGTQSADTLYTAANGAYTTATSLRSELGFNGKSFTAYDDLQAIKAYVDTLENSIGFTTDTSTTASVFGRLKQIKEAVDAIDNTSLDLTDLMNKWGSLSASDIYDKVKDLSSEISAINSVSNVSSILTLTTSNTTNITEIKNQVLAMRALLDVNKTQLERISNQIIIKTWLEEGSIIFKTLLTNPSSLTNQSVTFIYNFPPEVEEKHIIKKSAGVDIKYDPTQSVYFATGEFTLKPKETIILEVEVEDIWKIPDEKIESIKKQSTELFEPLKKTSYFAQGATLHSDILASLDKIVEIQKNAFLPEERIKAFREASIELESVNRKLENLKNLVTQSGSIGTLSGFIGGVQAIAVWGIIVILIAGFVFLAIYIKSLAQPKPSGISESVFPKTDITTPSTPPPSLSKVYPPTGGPTGGPPPPSPLTKKSKNPHLKKYLIFIIFGLSTGISSTSLFLYLRSRPSVLSASITKVNPPAGGADNGPTNQPTAIPTLIPVSLPDDSFDPESVKTNPPTGGPTGGPTSVPVGGQKTLSVIVVPSVSGTANVRSAPSRESTLVAQVVSGQQLSVIGEKFNDLGEKWLNVTFNNQSGWILGQLVQSVQTSATSEASQNISKIYIVVPKYDTVYLYSRPSFSASVTYKITDNQSAEILVETQRWAKVMLTRINVEGWVSQDFIEKNLP
jgi:SH3-like domain-containing protein